MALTKYTIRCSECGEKWSVIADSMPRFCAVCGVADGVDDDFVPSQLNIGTVKGRVVDQTFREMEASSIVRAEAAGSDALKITDMKDGLREGDVAAKKVTNIVTQVADAMKEMGGGDYFQASGQSSIAETLTMVKSGQERTTGARVLRAIQGNRVSVPQSVAGVKPNWGGKG